MWRLEGRDRRVFLLNAFSANDPVSTALLQEFARRSVALPRPWVALLNNRADRPRRMDAFLDFLQTDASCEAVALGGELGRLARRRLGRARAGGDLSGEGNTMPLIESIAIGLLAGFFLYEWIGLSPGGFVVPGYVALCLDRPWALGATLGASFLTLFIVRALSRWVILYGRRRFTLMLLTGFACQWLRVR